MEEKLILLPILTILIPEIFRHMLKETEKDLMD